MKDQRSNHSSSKSTTAQKSTGVRAVMIRKNTPEEAILRRIKEYLLYTKLRSLIPAQTPELRRNSLSGSEAATEIELEGHEIPGRDSDEEIVDSLSSPPSSRRLKQEEVAEEKEEDEEEEEEEELEEEEEEDEEEEEEEEELEEEEEEDEEEEEEEGEGEEQEKGCSVVIESGEEQEEGLKKFVPSVRIKKMDGSLLISTIVLKDFALTSTLFQILEEEHGIDVVFENQFRTESRVAHTIQVKVNKSDYDVDLLEKKLCRWAGKPM